MSRNKAIHKLLYNLPPQLRGWWWTSRQLRKCLVECGAPVTLTDDEVQGALQVERSGLLSKRMYNNTRYYILGLEHNAKYKTPDAQVRSGTSNPSSAMKTLLDDPLLVSSISCLSAPVVQEQESRTERSNGGGGGGAENNTNTSSNTIYAGNGISGGTETAPTTGTTGRAASIATISITSTATGDGDVSSEISSNDTACSTGTSGAETISKMGTPTGLTVGTGTTIAGATTGSIASLSRHNTSGAKGQDRYSTSSYKFINEDIDHEWTNVVEKHAHECRRSKLEVVDMQVNGCEVTDHYQCKWCKEDFIKRSSLDVVEHSGPGRPPAEINRALAAAAYKAGVGVEKGAEMLNLAAVHTFSEQGWRDAEAVVKGVVKPLGKEQLRLNRIKHNRACRAQPKYKDDIEFTDSDGIKHSIARGPICIDGSGDVRAYGHKVTGSQHCFVVYSLLTGDPLLLVHHQSSCQKCSLLLTEKLKENDSADLSSVVHEGCHRNTTHSPATAEEDAAEIAGRLLLKSDDNGSFLNDDEAIFGDDVVSDGDTRARNKLILTQSTLIGDAAKGVAKGYPSIEHWVKTVSNGLYLLARTVSSLRGVGLLNAPRIRAIVSDINRAIRLSNLVLALIDKRTDEGVISPELAKPKRDAELKLCLKDVYAIVPHHCGDHRSCSERHCRYKQIIRALKARKKLQKVDYTKEVVEGIYAQQSRFNGANLGATGKGRAALEHVIRSRIDENNVASLVRVLTSNSCENFFMMLTKYSEGKRKNLGQADSWESYQLLCAGLRSNDGDDSVFFNKILAELHVRRSPVRDAYCRKKNQWKEKAKCRKKSVEYKKRQAMSLKKKAIRMGKEAAKKERHMTEKMKPNDVGPVKAKKKRASKPQKCSNCHELGHSCKDCPEPSRKKSTVKQPGMSEVEIMELC